MPRCRVSESWIFFDSFWFTFITLTTIGYGDQGAFYNASQIANATEADCALDWNCKHK